jgi:hypothetical protein
MIGTRAASAVVYTYRCGIFFKQIYIYENHWYTDLTDLKHVPDDPPPSLCGIVPNGEGVHSLTICPLGPSNTRQYCTIPSRYWARHMCVNDAPGFIPRC